MSVLHSWDKTLLLYHIPHTYNLFNLKLYDCLAALFQKLDLVANVAFYRCGRIGIGMTAATAATAARRSGRGVKCICIDIWVTVSRFPMKLLGPADPPNDDSSSQAVWFNALALRYSVAQITRER